MIWLSDGVKLVSNKIISVNDKKLKQIIEKNSIQANGLNYNYGAADETQTPKEQLVKTILSKRFNRQKNIWALEIAQAALSKKYDETFNLRNLFKNCQHDLKIIKTTLNSEERLKIAMNTYSGFCTFLDIYSLIALEPVETYDIEELNKLVNMFANMGIYDLRIKKILECSYDAFINKEVLDVAKTLTMRK